MAAVESHHLAAPASARLYDRHYGRVLSYCLWRLGKPEDAEDAAQSTFLNAHQALSRGTAPTSEGAWLLAIANNVCLARWRAQRSRPREVAQEPEALAALAAPDRNPELLASLRHALGRLPEQQRRAFVLREWQGRSYAEIGEELGISESAVASLVFRARQTLAERLHDERPRRRVHCLDLASLLGWAKSLLGGTAAKLAVAGAVAGIATVAVTLPVASSHTRHVVKTRPTTASPPSHRAPAIRSAPSRADVVTRRTPSSHKFARQAPAPVPVSARRPPETTASAPTSAPNPAVPSDPQPAGAPAAPSPGTVLPPPPAPTVSVPQVSVPKPPDAVGQVTDVAQQVTSQLPTVPGLPPAPKLGP